MPKPKIDGRPRLLVIGARGFLGTFVVKSAEQQYQVICGDRTIDSDATDVAIDITDQLSVTRAFDQVRPDAVMLLAAISDIDRCQWDRNLAKAVNLNGAEYVANACARLGARLLFTSTGAVFDGQKHGYTEEDPVSPISYYGETKAQAESAVTALVPSAIIVRLSLILGRSGKPGTNSLVDSLIRRWTLGETIGASVIEYRNPIDASTLSEWLVELIRNDRSQGVFHTGSTDSMNRYELARAIASSLRFSLDLIRPELHPAAGRAPRGLDHWLLTDKISKACTTQPPNCEQVIERSLNEVAEGSIRVGI